MAAKALNLENIQGNILGGFNKDFQSFRLLKFKSAPKGRAWIKEICDPDSDVGVAKSSSADVLKFNAQFKSLRAEGIKPESVIAAVWTNLALSFQGLKALNVKATDLQKFPAAFKQGMAARNTVIGDVGDSAPAKWIAPLGSADVHAILQVAADDEAALNDRVTAITATGAFAAGVTVLLPLEGRTREGAQAGHEHFGFKDGVSQPGVRGVTVPDDPVGNRDQGHPGQDLLWPGEFVLGYPTQIPKAPAGTTGFNPNPGPVGKSGPAWTVDGSYLVFRRLVQDVPAFDQQLTTLAAQAGLSKALMGAKLVGRYQSGCPLEERKFQPQPFTPASVDPGIATPALANDHTLNLNFEFGHDANGTICPLGAHIRKAYPRDEQTLKKAGDSEPDTQTHRLLRRGIPFGASIGPGPGGKPSDPRGLLFFCYQKDLETQFEFVQSKWINNASFPPFPAGATPGQDPIIAQSASGLFQFDPAKPSVSVNHFVTTTGGEYFFAPSVEALQKIGANQI
jgi:Dyp-type peroxidase family